MQLYNSYTKKIETINEEQINLYVCGPTVYNDIHIGNARPLIVFDVLHRYLLASNKQVHFLHNITDIDDKIINAAIAQKKPELEISSYFEKRYLQVCQNLNILPVHIERVSDHLNGMIDYIQRMVQANVAYIMNGNVYFDTSKVKDYGILANRKLNEQWIGERIALSEEKRNDTDFILWKNTDKGIKWQSPWAEGRPGWHSECSYLIEKYFQNNLTIHGGGIDLKFPHHENENAQHNGLHHVGLSKIWMHVGHINIDQTKMSKSLNNFVLVKDLLMKYDYQTIRFFMYKTNYRNPLEYNDLIMQACQNEVQKIEHHINIVKTILIAQDAFKLQLIHHDDFLNCLDNDLNITNGLSIIYSLIKQNNLLLRNKQYLTLNLQLNQILSALDILGIVFSNIHTQGNIKLIKEYYDYLEQKDFKNSDILRKSLMDKGLI